jgi:hypothetical protein
MPWRWISIDRIGKFGTKHRDAIFEMIELVEMSIRQVALEVVPVECNRLIPLGSDERSPRLLRSPSACHGIDRGSESYLNVPVTRVEP